MSHVVDAVVVALVGFSLAGLTLLVAELAR